MKYFAKSLFIHLLLLSSLANAVTPIVPNQTQNVFNTIRPVNKEFDLIFKSKKDLEDLVRLKDFIQSKDDQLQRYIAISIKLEDSILLYRQSSNLLINLDTLSKSVGLLERLIEKKHIGEVLLKNVQSDSELSNNFLFKTFRPRWTNDATIDANLEGFKEWFDGFKSLKNQYEQVNENIQNAKSDISNAEEQVQRIFNVNNYLNNTKLWISVAFSLIILILLTLFFIFLLRVADKDTGRLFLTGNGIQFVALFALIISIVLFGVLGILGGRELAAILSGISGFILGKNSNSNGKKSGRGKKQKQKTVEPQVEATPIVENKEPHKK